MEFQIAEAIELIKTLAETENLTQSQALVAFVAEAELDVEYASILKAALFEEYTLQEMASDSMTKALYNVFVSGAEVEDVQEMETKETQEGTKYKVRVKDRASGSTYSRYATRAKIAELRANPNIASVELSDYGSTGEDDRGERTASAKRGDYDGDGKRESSSKEHAGVVHNAIQRKMGGKPDGQDTRKEEVEALDEIMKHQKERDRIESNKKKEEERIKKARSSYGKQSRYSPPTKGVHGEIERRKKEKPPSRLRSGSLPEWVEISKFDIEEGKKEADLDKMERQERKHLKKSTSQRGGGRGDSKNRAMKMSSIRSAVERGEDPRRDTYGGRRTGKDGTHPPEDHRKAFTRTPLKDRPAKEPGVKKESAWEAYLELRENRRAARSAGGYVDDSKKQTDPSKDGFTGISGSIKDIMRQNKEIEARNKKKTKKEEVELDENRRAARAAGGYVDDSKKQTDPSKKGFTGISNDIEEIKRQSAAIDKAKKKEVAKEEWKPDPVEKREKKAKSLYDREQVASAQKGTKYETDKTEDPDKLYKRRQAIQFKRKMRKEDFVMEADLVDAGRENQTQRDKKKLSGNGVDNSREVRLMPYVDESVVTEHGLTSAQKRLLESGKNLELRSQIKSLVAEECCDKCGTPECTCESKKEDKKDKKKSVKIDESGMPILEYSRNNARPGPSPEMINPGKDPEGDVGHMNPKGKPKRYKNRGEAPGDRRPNDPTGPELPFDKGTVPNGSGV